MLKLALRRCPSVYNFDIVVEPPYPYGGGKSIGHPFMTSPQSDPYFIEAGGIISRVNLPTSSVSKGLDTLALL